MKIGRKLIAVVLTVMIVFTSVVLLQRYLEVKRMCTIFNERKQTTIANFAQIVEMVNKKLETYAIESTYWDEMVKAVENKDTDWFKSSVEQIVLTANNYNGVWIFNKDKTPVFSTGTEEKGFIPEFPIPAETFDLLLDGKVVCHFFIKTSKGFMEINGAKIYPGSDPARQTTPRGYFFAGKLWDTSYITNIAKMTSLNIYIYPYDEKLLEDESNFQEGKIFFTHTFCGWDKKPLAIVKAWSEFTQLKAINKAFTQDMYLFLGFASTLLAIILYVIVKWINRPLKLISETLAKDDTAFIKKLQEEKSEFGDVAGLISKFFQQRDILNENEQKYKMIFDTANDSILLMQKDKYIDCNEKTLELFGCTREQILNSQPYIFSPPRQPDGRDSTEKALEYIKAAIAGQPQRFEWLHWRYDKSTFDAEVSLNTFTMGSQNYIQTIVRDISKHKKAEAEMKRLNYNLEEANQELRNFVYVASHDLREPLRKITAFGGMLQKSLKNKLLEEDTENLGFMIEGAHRMNKMIEGLLAYSKVSTKAHLPQDIDLNEIVSQLREFELSVMIEEMQAVICVPNPLPHIHVDVTQIRQLMQNLLANGLKFHKPDAVPQVFITSKPAANGMVRIEITDNGIGIKPEYLQSIFTMFKKLHTPKDYEGTGIGLTICKKIVERFCGKIGVESIPGIGSTFWFTVPSAVTSVASEHTAGKADNI
ncbi:MAG: PAS domain S-box protein [Planctomycetaceae bacterium]|nr:PAS domain S-box protein [Planctomycetaceae bacterium]